MSKITNSISQRPSLIKTKKSLENCMIMCCKNSNNPDYDYKPLLNDESMI